MLDVHLDQTDFQQAFHLRNAFVIQPQVLFKSMAHLSANHAPPCCQAVQPARILLLALLALILVLWQSHQTDHISSANAKTPPSTSLPVSAYHIPAAVKPIFISQANSAKFVTMPTTLKKILPITAIVNAR